MADISLDFLGTLIYIQMLPRAGVAITFAGGREMPTVLVVDGGLTVSKLERVEGIDVAGGAHLVRHEPLEGYFPDIVAVRELLVSVDLVVVGNNLGAGVRVVSELPESLRGRTLVVSHEPLDDN